MGSDSLKPSVRNFARAAGSHWVALMSGGIVTVMMGVSERVIGRNVPLNAYLIVILLFVILACYLAWRDERNASLTKQAESEKVIAELHGQLDERARQKEIREALGRFLGQGKKLQKMCSAEVDPPPSSEVQDWANEVGQWLWDNLGQGYTHRFDSAGQFASMEFLGFKSEVHKRLYTAVRIRVANLEQFIGELGID